MGKRMDISELHHLKQSRHAAKMDRTYYTLCVFEGGSWSPEFGAFAKDDVTCEQGEWLDHYDDNGKRRLKKHTRIITTRYGDGQAAIDATVATMNAKG